MVGQNYSLAWASLSPTKKASSSTKMTTTNVPTTPTATTTNSNDAGRPSPQDEWFERF